VTAHVVLVGLMGTGKTTVGRALAARLDRPFLDSDDLVERRAGRTVRELFVDGGEPAFRDLETEVLADALAAGEPSVIAAAGGVVIRPTNRDALTRADAHVVWLQAEPSTLVARVTGAGHRPLLDDDPAGTLTRMGAERAAWYAEVADQALVVEGRSVDDLVAEIVASMERVA
jgi:shikimate kinase